MTFFEIFFCVAHLPIETKHFYFIKISYLQSFREIKEGQTKHHFSAKNDASGQKIDFFRNFLFCCTSTLRDKKKLFNQNFISLTVQRNHGGDKKNVNFRLKLMLQAKKIIFRKKNSVAHLPIETIFFSTKISYLQPFREIKGGQTNVNFRLKITLQAKKMTFSKISFLLTSTH